MADHPSENMLKYEEFKGKITNGHPPLKGYRFESFLD
jgi:hypothetical protein